jgi:hypothetical protein
LSPTGNAHLQHSLPDGQLCGDLAAIAATLLLLKLMMMMEQAAVGR